jgi:hypothetical protein
MRDDARMNGQESGLKHREVHGGSLDRAPP